MHFIRFGPTLSKAGQLRIAIIVSNVKNCENMRGMCAFYVKPHSPFLQRERYYQHTLANVPTNHFQRYTEVFILYTWNYTYPLRKEIFQQNKSSFQSNPVTKPLVTQSTTRHQMKGMDIGHHLSDDTPQLSVGLVVWILQPLKVKHFFKMLEMPKGRLVTVLRTMDPLNVSHISHIMKLKPTFGVKKGHFRYKNFLRALK